MCAALADSRLFRASSESFTIHKCSLCCYYSILFGAVLEQEEEEGTPRTLRKIPAFFKFTFDVCSACLLSPLLLVSFTLAAVSARLRFPSR